MADERKTRSIPIIVEKSKGVVDPNHSSCEEVGIFKLYPNEKISRLKARVSKLRKLAHLKIYEGFRARLILYSGRSAYLSDEYPCNKNKIGIPRNLVYKRDNDTKCHYEFIDRWGNL